MISIFKRLYITDRFFVIQGGVVFLFFVAFVLPKVFYVAVGLLLIAMLAFIFDIYTLFRIPNIVSADRKLSTVMNLGEDHEVQIEIKNNRRLGLKLTLIDELPPQLEYRDFRIEFELDSEAKQTLTYNMRPLIRGKYSFGDINIFLRSGLGLISKKEVVATVAEVAVYPSVVHMKQQELIALHHVGFAIGESKSRKLGKSYEFDRIKPYIVGDDPRNINWKATSKRMDLMVNQFEDERSQQVYSIIDKGRTMKMPFEGLTLVDYAINATLAFSNIVLKKHDKAGLISFSDKINSMLISDRSSSQLKKMQKALYNEKYHYSESDFEMLYINLRRTIPNRSLIFLYTNFDTLNGLERALPALKTINRLHLLVVIFFNNTELEAYSMEPSETVLDIYQHTMAQKFIMEKDLIAKELTHNGIATFKCDPDHLSASVINKYLQLKTDGLF